MTILHLGEIELNDRMDCLKLNWYLWSCTREINGIWVDGTVQADTYGDLIAEETFEKD